MLIFFRGLFVLLLVQNETNFFLMLFFIYLVVFYNLQAWLAPYDSKRFNSLQKMDLNFLKLNVSNTVISLIWNLSGQELSNYLKIIVLLYLLVTNIIFIFLWLATYFFKIRKQLTVVQSVYHKIFRTEKSILKKFIEWLSFHIF